MLTWMVTHPAQFLAVQHALSQMGSNAIPTSQLPPYLQTKTIIPYGVHLDDDQRKQISTISLPNDVPGEDVIALAKSIERNGGWGWAQQHFGNIPRAMIAEAIQQTRDAKDPVNSTWLGKHSGAAKAMVGRPVRTFTELNDPAQSAWNTVFNPGNVQDIDPDKQAHVTVKSAKDALFGARMKYGAASLAVEDAKKKFVASHKNWTEAEAVKLSETDPVVRSALKDLADAAQNIRTHEAYMRRVQADVVRLSKMYEGVVERSAKAFEGVK